MNFGAELRDSSETDRYLSESGKRFKIPAELRTPGKQFLLLVSQKKPHTSFPRTLLQPPYRRQNHRVCPAFAS